VFTGFSNTDTADLEISYITRIVVWVTAVGGQVWGLLLGEAVEAGPQ